MQFDFYWIVLNRRGGLHSASSFIAQKGFQDTRYLLTTIRPFTIADAVVAVQQLRSSNFVGLCESGKVHVCACCNFPLPIICPSGSGSSAIVPEE